MSDDRQLFSVFSNGDGRSLRLEGELDAATVPQLHRALTTLNGESEVILDLAGLTFIDSTGLHAIVAYVRSRGPDALVTLTHASAHIVRLFEITRINELPGLRIDG